ncbi:MAG TPA: hypothetical protein VFG14_20160, partial [Chthoniobacteraceae bacterium]|nr:hypothetical protein [Chthoniobacteraceae bacterium]
MLRPIFVLASTLLVGTATLVAQAAENVTTYIGCCDASAAVAVDGEHFVVADDEDNVLRVYRREGGSPIMNIDLGS